MASGRSHSRVRVTERAAAWRALGAKPPWRQNRRRKVAAVDSTSDWIHTRAVWKAGSKGGAETGMAAYISQEGCGRGRGDLCLFSGPTSSCSLLSGSALCCPHEHPPFLLVGVRVSGTREAACLRQHAAFHSPLHSVRFPFPVLHAPTRPFLTPPSSLVATLQARTLTPRLQRRRQLFNQFGAANQRLAPPE